MKINNMKLSSMKFALHKFKIQTKLKVAFIVSSIQISLLLLDIGKIFDNYVAKKGSEHMVSNLNAQKYYFNKI